MQPNHFELHYEGNATRNHSMDIAVTRDVLSALDILVRRVSKKTDKEEDIVVDVQAFKEGCFAIELAILGGVKVTAFHLMGLIGITAVAHGGVLGFLDWKKGRKNIEIIKGEDGEVEVKDLDTNEVKKTTEEVVKLSSDSKITAQLHRIFVEPFERLDLDRVFVSQNNQTTVVLPKTKAETLFEGATEEHLDNWVLDHIVTVEQVSLTSEGKWRVYIHGYNRAVTATMVDDNFQKLVEEGAVTFRAKDKMEVLLEKDVTRKGVRKTNTYTIHKVHKHWHIDQ
ncbi:MULTISPECIES: hypothetical protein [Vibrio]|nr:MULTISPECIES: hypothetical protein [Vibrio]MBF4383611.1 hypothetical protein [Vibrio anguillarum]MBF4394470.1 hypothetical protein [Vibrio anguillarum]MBF4429222.1 hypothetical protein [Vibrio anguillarum]NAW80392.1 hypothetical protein [Vibrio sp. V33_P6A3T137]